MLSLGEQLCLALAAETARVERLREDAGDCAVYLSTETGAGPEMLADAALDEDSFDLARRIDTPDM